MCFRLFSFYYSIVHVHLLGWRCENEKEKKSWNSLNFNFKCRTTYCIYVSSFFCKIRYPNADFYLEYMRRKKAKQPRRSSVNKVYIPNRSVLARKSVHCTPCVDAPSHQSTSQQASGWMRTSWRWSGTVFSSLGSLPIVVEIAYWMMLVEWMAVGKEIVNSPNYGKSILTLNALLRSCEHEFKYRN